MIRRFRPLVLVLATGALALSAVGLAAPANAAVNRPFDKITPVGTGASDGRAQVKGTLTWISATQFRITGTINDLCNDGSGDDFGAYFNGTITYRDGSGRGMGNPNIAVDERGCREAARSFSYTSPASAKRILRLNLVVQEIDLEGGRGGDRVPWVADNPYTG